MNSNFEKHLESARQDVLDALMRMDDYLDHCKMMEDLTDAERKERAQYFRNLEMRGWS
jgi:hypothetical protein